MVGLALTLTPNPNPNPNPDQVCDGYLVDPQNPDPDIVAKNKEDFVTIDGIRYFCTGDIGQITPAGSMQIIQP